VSRKIVPTGKEEGVGNRSARRDFPPITDGKEENKGKKQGEGEAARSLLERGDGPFK